MPELNDLESFDLLDQDDIFNDFIDHEGPIYRATPQECAEQILTKIELINGFGLLQENLYLRSNPLNSRSVLDYACILPQRVSYEFDWIVGTHLFYNQTTRNSFFSKNCDNFSGYLAITTESLLEKISQSFDVLRPQFPQLSLNPLRILPLFRNGTVQERRLGFLGHAFRQYNYINMRILLPFYYLERNFFFTEGEREAIERELGAQAPINKQNLQIDILLVIHLALVTPDLNLTFPYETVNYIQSALA